jgi:hypothetical protein
VRTRLVLLPLATMVVAALITSAFAWIGLSFDPPPRGEACYFESDPSSGWDRVAHEEISWNYGLFSVSRLPDSCEFRLRSQLPRLVCRDLACDTHPVAHPVVPLRIENCSKTTWSASVAPLASTLVGPT